NRKPRSRRPSARQTKRTKSLSSYRGLFLCDAIEKLFASQIEFLVHQRRRRAERIIQMIHGQRGVLAVVAQDNRRAIAACHIDATSSADGRREDEITNSIDPEWFAGESAGRRVQTHENVLVVPDVVERVVVKQRRRDVGR